MTALHDASPRTRLRVAADTAPGARVLVAVEDLLAVLAGRDDTPHDLDALDGQTPMVRNMPADIPARPLEQDVAKAADRVAAAVRSAHVVVLPVSCEGARRLAEAAWTSSWHTDLGPWMSPSTAPGCAATIEAAHRVLEHLAGQPEHDERGAGPR